MERTGGKPDVVGYDKSTGEYIFYDCSAESPKGRTGPTANRDDLMINSESENTRLTAFLQVLHPQTLAHIVVDLEEAQEDWEFYPEDAPDAATQQTLREIAATVRQVGAAQANAAQLDFDQLLEQARDARQSDDWLADRNRQDRRNWFSDYQ